MIGVDHDELEPLEVFHFKAVNGIGAGAPDTDEFDGDATIHQKLGVEGQFNGIHDAAQEVVKSRVTLCKKPDFRRTGADFSPWVLIP
jgi:hypothetical protein